jgi:SagB-type dehydrogenase family enzyme
LGETILQRGSTRRFARESIPLAKFSAVLASATTPVAADFLPPGQPSLLETYLIANGVEDLEPGSYRYSPGQHSLELLRQGNLRHEAGHLCFEQALGADASTVFFFMADLDQVLSRWGNRGYRAAQLEAGILGGRVYLAAHALGLGASGMTFYDEDVSEFFATDQVPRSGNQADRRPRKSLMFLVALGLTHQVNRVRPFRSRVGILLDSLARGAGGAPVNSKI